MTKTIFKITKKNELMKIILLGTFDNSIQIKNNEHICKDGTIYDYSSITNMSDMFFGCISLNSIPLFDTSNVTNMSDMFFGCTSLTSIPLFDTSNVTSMDTMFYNCISLNSIPFLNISSLLYFTGIFKSCSSLPKTEQVKFFYQEDKLLLKNLENNPELFSEQKLNILLSKYN
jgi:surface protein